MKTYSIPSGLPAVGGIPLRMSKKNTIIGNGTYEKFEPTSDYQQKVDARYGSNSDVVSYFDRQRDLYPGGYEANKATYNSNHYSGGEQVGPGMSRFRFSQKMESDGGLAAFNFPKASFDPRLGFSTLKAISMPSSGETIDKAIEAVGSRRLATGAFANTQDQYAFEDLTALKTSGNIYAPSTQFQIKKQTNANAVMAKDIESQKERSTLEAKIRSKSSEESIKRKTSFRKTTISLGNNGLRIPSGTGS